jgi:hypothetical protein
VKVLSHFLQEKVCGFTWKNSTWFLNAFCFTNVLGQNVHENVSRSAIITGDGLNEMYK